MSFLGDVFDNVGTALNLPEFGLSETANKGNATANTGRVAYTPSAVSLLTADPFNSALSQKTGGGGGFGDTPTETTTEQNTATAQAQARAAASSAARKNIGVSVNNAAGASRQSVNDTANKYRTDSQTFLNNLESGQNDINSARNTDALTLRRSMATIVNAVRNGLKSGGITLANMNAADSSASDAVARAVAKQGNGQSQSANNDFELASQDLDAKQGILNRNKDETLANFDSYRDNEVNRIRGDLSSKLDTFDAQANEAGVGGIVDKGLVNQIVQEAIAQLSQVDQTRQQRLGAVTAVDRDASMANAARMDAAGIEGGTPFTVGGGGIDLSTQDPAATTQPIVNTQLPFYTRKDDTQLATA